MLFPEIQVSCTPYPDENGNCIHYANLLKFLKDNNLDIYSEQGESPQGWVNIHCRECGIIYQESLTGQLYPEEVD